MNVNVGVTWFFSILAPGGGHILIFVRPTGVTKILPRYFHIFLTLFFQINWQLPNKSVLHCIPSHRVWLSMSTRNFIGSGQNSAYSLLLLIRRRRSSIYKAHLILQRTSQCASLLLQCQENRHNHFASNWEQLAKCMPYQHLDCNIFPRMISPWCAQVNETTSPSTQHALPVSRNMRIFFGSVQILIRGPLALKASALTNLSHGASQDYY